MNLIRKYRNVVLPIVDAIVIVVSYCIASMIILNSISINTIFSRESINTMVIAIVVYLFMLTIFRTYKNITRYENGNDYLVYVLACLISYTLIMCIKQLFNIPLVDIRVNMIAALIIVVAIISYIKHKN